MADIRENRLNPDHSETEKALREQRQTDELMREKERKDGVTRQWATSKEQGALGHEVDEVAGTHDQAGVPLPNEIAPEKLKEEMGKLIQLKPKQIVEKAEELRNSNLGANDLHEGLTQLLEAQQKEDLDQSA